MVKFTLKQFAKDLKGQAAVTDALIFLSIVGVISTMIIVSAMNYGLIITDGIQDNYETTYLDASIKTFYVVNQGRDGQHLLDTTVGDYLMTKIKEDFASADKKVIPETKYAIFKTLDQVFLMFPQKSYLISIIYTKSSPVVEQKAVFVGIRTKTNDGDNVYLDCNPGDPIESLQTYLGAHILNQRITLGNAIFYEDILTDPKKVDGEIYLSMWTTTPDFDGMPRIDDVADFTWTQDRAIEGDLNCFIFDADDIYPTTP